MAVPKKRTSKSKKRIRRASWLGKAKKAALKAFSLAKSTLTNRSGSFSYTRSNGSSESPESAPTTESNEL